MSDPLRAWVEDAARSSDWSPKDLYGAALEIGVKDRRAVYLAIALLDAAEKVRRAHPTVPFDDICDGVARGILGQPEMLSATVRTRARLAFGYWVTKLRHRTRRKWWTRS